MICFSSSLDYSRLLKRSRRDRSDGGEQEIFLSPSLTSPTFFFSFPPLMWSHFDLCLPTFLMSSLAPLLFTRPYFTLLAPIHPYTHSSIYPSNARSLPLPVTAVHPIFICPSSHPSFHSGADFYLLCRCDEKSAIHLNNTLLFKSTAIQWIKKKITNDLCLIIALIDGV